MRYYYGFFKDVRGELFKIVIESSNDGKEETYVQPELLLSDSPFNVDFAGSEDLYKPYKCSTATVSMYNREFDPYLNSQTGLDVRVKLLQALEVYDDDYDLENSDLKLRSADTGFFKVVWSGYATPNAYAQGYNSYNDLFDLECQDILSATRYMKSDSTMPSSDMTFAEFLGSTICNRTRGVFKEYFVTQSIRIPVANAESLAVNTIFNQIRFNKELLTNYDDEGEKYSILNIIEKYCKTLNMTAVQQAETLYFINYEAIAQGYNSYSQYLSDTLWFYDSTRKNEVVLGIDGTKEDVRVIASNDTNLSLHEIYSDYKIGTDYLAIDADSIDLSDELSRTKWNKMDKEDTYVVESPLKGPEERHEFSYNVLFSHESTGEEVADDIRNGDHPGGGQTVRYQQFQMFGINRNAVKNFDVKFHAYNADVVETTVITKPGDTGGDPDYDPGNGNDPEYGETGGITDPDNPPPVIVETIKTWKAGSEITTYKDGDCNLQMANSKIVATPFGYYIDKKISNAPNYQYGYMMFHKGFLEYGIQDRHTMDEFYGDGKYTDQAMIDFIYNNVTLSKDNCILINGNVTWFNRIMPGDDVIDLENPQNYNTRLFLTASVKISNGTSTIYYNNGTWSAVKSKFKLTLEDSSDNAFNTTFGIKNTVQPPIHKLPNGTTGWCIPCPDGLTPDNYTVTVTIYRSWGCAAMMATRSTFISDWNVGFPVSTESNTYLTETSDTRYRQKISDIDSVYSDSFAMHTYDGKASHYSALLYTKTPYWLWYSPENVEKSYLGHIHNICLGDAMIAEELKIKALVNQYSRPCMILNAKVHASEMPYYSKFVYRRPALKDKVYVIDTMSVDYKYNIYDLNLYEKK